ncbi:MULTISPECIES: ABC transporter ATP-binding protein [Pontibacillus]|uniref:ABC transporter ATP-binding protein n=1 Tax=Pontibacillus chungwhensis TaxID=265426 RepID=A0ABY8V213_9BACI|nr:MULTISPECIES: ABC transporter ATP-binding protein [Pontibacillus]MCD5325524.1 ABC transporter ATP-binding protein [Pontibacillus sp. HN14]WIF98634.1 ABC transporter ATP-binding protein [Pontibacillus chungwhensis]
MEESQDILHVQGLRTSFFTDDGIVPAVDDISFTIQKGEVLGIVGESGCGKSVTSLSIMGLLPQAGKIIGGEITFEGESLTKANEKRMRSIRGNDMAMIFQEPMTSLNPLFKIGNQLTEAIRTHRSCTKDQAKKRAIEMLELVGLPRAEQLLNEYPHQLSGGMRQRVMIAMSMICDPKLLIADEPTTALDVTIQKQILQLMKELNHKLHTSIMMITHDLGVVAEVCDRVVVMYAGKIVEEAPVRTLFKEALHPYTQGLLASVPDIRSKQERLQSIPGNVPKPGSIKQGCRFAARCSHAMDRCHVEDPSLYTRDENHHVRCFLYDSQTKKEADHETTST